MLAHVDDHLDDAVTRLFALLRIESVSTDPACANACRDAADTLVADLQTIGFEASRRDTAGHPMVVVPRPGTGPVTTVRTCCSTATTTCSRSIRSPSGTARRSSPRSRRPTTDA